MLAIRGAYEGQVRCDWDQAVCLTSLSYAELKPMGGICT